jgi:hypothetical protein
MDFTTASSENARRYLSLVAVYIIFRLSSWRLTSLGLVLKTTPVWRESHAVGKCNANKVPFANRQVS